MRVTPPIDIGAASRLTSSTAADVHNPAEYAAGTTYGIGALVSVAADFTIYESLQGTNLAHTPSTSPYWWRILAPTETVWVAAQTIVQGATRAYNNRIYEALTAHTSGSTNTPPTLPETTNEYWTDVGPTNKWAMFDLSTNTKTAMAPGAPLTVVLAPGQRINTVGITGLSAHAVTVTATSVYGGGTVFGPVTTNLVIRNVADGYDYAFEPFRIQPSLAHFDLPAFSDIVVTITITAATGNVKCGAVVLGTYVYLGDVQYGARGDSINFSTVTRDAWGNATLVPRRSVDKILCTTKVNSFGVNKIRSVRSELNAVPALYSGLDDGSSEWFDMLLTVGIYKTFEIDASDPRQATIQLEVEEI
jgi:hypothetical protein